MRQFLQIRTVFAGVVFAFNAFFTLFLVIEGRVISKNLHPAPSQPPATYALIGSTAMTALLTVIAALFDVFFREKFEQLAQVFVEFAWVGGLVFAQYSTALIYTVLFVFSFECHDASSPAKCHRLQISTLAGGWLAAMLSATYVVLLGTAASRKRAWGSPIRKADWAGAMRHLSIASFANGNYESKTVKSTFLNYDAKAPKVTFGANKYDDDAEKTALAKYDANTQKSSSAYTSDDVKTSRATFATSRYDGDTEKTTSVKHDSNILKSFTSITRPRALRIVDFRRSTRSAPSIYSQPSVYSGSPPPSNKDFDV